MSIGHTRAASPAKPTDLEHKIAENRRRNSLVPINRLPAELLAIVFSLVREDDLKKIDYVWMQSLLRVCSRWLSIGLNTPFLWSAVAMLPQNMSYIPGVLQRSRQVRLDVYLVIQELRIAQDRDDLSPRQVDLSLERAHDIVAQMHRFRSLEIDIRDYFWKPNTTQVPSKLERLDLTLSDSDMDRFDISAHWLLSSNLRSLKELTITSDSQLSGVLSLANLRYLKFDAQNVDHGWRGSDLLKVLRSSPLLEELVINTGLVQPKVLNSEGEEVSPSVDPIHLPKLKTLTLCDRSSDPSSELSLLGHLIVPVEANLELQYRLLNPDSMTNALSGLSQTLNVPSSPKHPGCTTHRPLRILKIRNDIWKKGSRYGTEYFRSVHFTGCAHTGGCTEDKATKICTRKNLDISLVYTDNHNFPYTAFPWRTLVGFNDVLDLLPLAEVRVLRVEGRDAYNSLRQRLGLLSADEVPYAVAPPCGVFRPGQAHGGEADELVELEPIQREFADLTEVSMCLLPELDVRSTLEHEIKHGSLD